MSGFGGWMIGPIDDNDMTLAVECSGLSAC